MYARLAPVSRRPRIVWLAPDLVWRRTRASVVVMGAVEVSVCVLGVASVVSLLAIVNMSSTSALFSSLLVSGSVSPSLMALFRLVLLFHKLGRNDVWGLPPR